MPGPIRLDRALAAARRAVDLAPTHALGHYALATVHFFRKEMVPLSRRGGTGARAQSTGCIRESLSGPADSDDGRVGSRLQMVESAMQAQSQLSGVLLFRPLLATPIAKAGTRRCSRRGTNQHARLLPRPRDPRQRRSANSAGEKKRRRRFEDLLALRPDFAAMARQEYAKWYDAEHIEQIVDGLRKAGLECPGSPRRAATVDSAAG